MIDANARAMLRVILDEVCEFVGEYREAVRAHVAGRILAESGRELATIHEIRHTGRDALESDPRR